MSKERTQRGNPHQLSVRQHVHSAACIKRFADPDGNVAVRILSRGITFTARPNNDAFVAQRAWSHRSERRFIEIEDRYQRAIDSAIAGGTVDHEAVTDYFITWSIRSELNAAAQPAIALAGIQGDTLTQDQEEILERKGWVFVREDGEIPARLMSDLEIVRRYDIARPALAHGRWRVGIATGGSRFICPVSLGTASTRAMPIGPERAFIPVESAGPAIDLAPAVVRQLNHEVFIEAPSAVFGHPADAALLLQSSGA